MENAFDYSAFYEKFNEDDLFKNIELKEKDILPIISNLNEFKCVIFAERLLLKARCTAWNDLLAEGKIHSFSMKEKVSEIIYAEQFGNDDDDDNDDEMITCVLEAIKEVKKIHPKFETFLSGLGIEKVDEFIKVISQEDINERDLSELKAQLNNIKLDNPTKINLFLSLLSFIPKNGFGVESLSDEDFLIILLMFRGVDLIVKKNYYEYQNWKTFCLLNGGINFFSKISFVESLLVGYYIIAETDIIAPLFDELHSYITTSNRKNEILILFKQEKYAPYIQGLYKDYCIKQNVPIASRFHFSDKVKTFTQKGKINPQIKEEIQKENLVKPVNAYRMRMPEGYNEERLRKIHQSLQRYFDNNRENFVFLLGGGDIMYPNPQPINCSFEARELKYFIKRLYAEGKTRFQWLNVSKIFNHTCGDPYTELTLRTGKSYVSEKLGSEIEDAIKTSKSDT